MFMALGGCYYGPPPPAYGYYYSGPYYAGPYYYGPPVVGSVFIGGRVR
jgi:hypothetical protein